MLTSAGAQLAACYSCEVLPKRRECRILSNIGKIKARQSQPTDALLLFEKVRCTPRSGETQAVLSAVSIRARIGFGSARMAKQCRMLRALVPCAAVQALRIMRSALGAAHPDVAKVLLNIGTVHAQARPPAGLKLQRFKIAAPSRPRMLTWSHTHSQVQSGSETRTAAKRGLRCVYRPAGLRTALPSYEMPSQFSESLPELRTLTSPTHFSGEAAPLLSVSVRSYTGRHLRLQLRGCPGSDGSCR